MTTRGVLLDVDGTLVLSNDAHAQAWVDAFGEFGHSVPFERVRWLIGMGGDKLLPTVIPGLSADEPPGKDISALRQRIFLERYAPDLKAAPGARGLVEGLRARGLRLMVASSATQEELGTLLRAAGVADLLTEATTKDDVDHSKPDPDSAGVAARKLGLPPEECVLVGDTPYDVEAAARAGVRAVAVRCGGWGDESLAGAVAIYNDPADLATHLDESPLADGK